MTPEEEALGRVVAILEAIGIPCMITGSMATSYCGRPRATHDADVVIDPTPEHMETLLAQLESAHFYAPGAAARDALRYADRRRSRTRSRLRRIRS